MTTDGLRVEYIEARRTLLDALTALQPHIGAVVLIGAQAIYLRTAGRLPGYQPFTTDADLALEPTRLAELPLLADAMRGAGFEFTGEPGIWVRRVQRAGFTGELTVPVDLIVPDQIAAKAGRRGARLPGGHGNTAARKCAGVEGAVVDHDLLEIAALDDADSRRARVRVAGPAALLVAKAHKLGERLDTPQRLLAKDAGDVYRLIEATSLADMDRLMQVREPTNDRPTQHRSPSTTCRCCSPHHGHQASVWPWLRSPSLPTKPPSPRRSPDTCRTCCGPCGRAATPSTPRLHPQKMPVGSASISASSCSTLAVGATRS